MQSDSKIQRKLLFLKILQISLFLIVILLPYDINAQIFPQNQSLHNYTLEEKVREIGAVEYNPQINVGNSPIYIEISKDKVYVANALSGTVSVISAENNTKIAEIPVGVSPVAIVATYNKVYVANALSDTVSVISAKNNTKIADIPVGKSPVAIVATYNKVYVANANSDTVSVISAKNNIKIAEISDIPVSLLPIRRSHLATVNMEVVFDKVYIGSGHDLSVISAKNNTKIAEISGISEFSQITAIGTIYDKVYAAHFGPGVVSVISAENNTKIAEISEGFGADLSLPTDIYTTFDKVYVANALSGTVSVISAENNTKIAEIPVGKGPIDIDFNDRMNTLYVAHRDSNTVSVISAENNTKIAEIPVGPIGKGPIDINFNYRTNTLYVTNTFSDGIYVIDGITNKIVVGVKLNVNPPNSGYIKCNDLDFPLNQFFYVSSECTAKPNKGFEFISWIENLENNSNRTIKISKEDNYILESLYDIFGYKPDDSAASIFQFGNYTANFKALPSPIPSEYLIPLYGIIITTIVGWSIPSIINWIRTKNDIKKLNYYHKEITSIYNDGKLDVSDLDHLNKLKKSMSDDYSKGKLNERHYESLEKEISISYEEIFMKRINSIINDTSTNKEDKKKQLIKINEDIEDAYSKSRINELHNTLLKEKIESLKTMADSSNNKFLKKSPL